MVSIPRPRATRAHHPAAARRPAFGFALLVALLAAVLLLGATAPASARPEYREGFFLAYPSAVGSRLDNVPSNQGHCGVCHWRFNGGGPRNPYGAAVGARFPSYPSTPQGRRDAVLSITGQDSDGDAYTNAVEITDLANYLNTPTFPGLTQTNVGQVSQVTLSDISGYLTPIPGSDTTPPVVTVLAPNGGENLTAHGPFEVRWTATDANGVARVDIALSTDGGATFKPLALATPNDGSFVWFVQDYPGGASRVRVEAWDPSNNRGQDLSNASFTITAPQTGRVPTTLRDFDLPGTQPLGGGDIQSVTDCIQCHGNYDQAVEPVWNWKGSLMAQAARDPLFYAALAVANQDARDSGDLCLRCHTQTGWLGGRSTPPSGSQLVAGDREGVNCDVCHGMVDPIYAPGVSPPEDQAILAALGQIPPDMASGMTVIDPTSAKRGPFTDPFQANHGVIPSPFHREAGLCGTCHNVSNPAFSKQPDGRYAPNDFDAPAPSFDPYEQFPVERTYGEWLMSEYNTPGGVYAPQFAGAKPDGMVATCQDCHLRDVVGAGAGQPAGVPIRPDLPLHDMTGGNTWMAQVIPDLYAGEVDPQALAAAAARALYMLENAASLGVQIAWQGGVPVAAVTVTNESGHKLPTGYPEGRRMWINVRAFDAANALVYESGAYDAATGVLAHDEDLRLYEAELGISPALAGALGLTAGPSFHFVLNDSIYKDNRIPPRGFTNAGFALVQATPVDPDWPGPEPRYDDGQHWDEAHYDLPATSDRLEVTLYYQTTSKEYVEFLRDENTTNQAGNTMHSAWTGNGRAAPVAMATAIVDIDPTAVGGAGAPPVVFGLDRPSPHPFRGAGTLVYRLSERGAVDLAVYDVGGRRVRTLLGGEMAPAGVHRIPWDGRDDSGQAVASGLYFLRIESGGRHANERLVLIK